MKRKSIFLLVLIGWFDRTAKVTDSVGRYNRYSDISRYSSRDIAYRDTLGLNRFSAVLAIFAFSTTCTVSTVVSFSVTCNNTSPVEKAVAFSYPFKLEDVEFKVPKCDGRGEQDLKFVAGAWASSQFYVFNGVMAFLYSLAAIVLYVFFDDLYRKKNSIIVADFILTIVFTMLWLISSSTWAQGVSDAKYHTDPATGIFPHADACKTGMGNTCTTKALGNFVSLNVSIIFGFLNMLVWGGNSWFLYKETLWIKVRAIPTDPTAPNPSEAQLV